MPGQVVWRTNIKRMQDDRMVFCGFHGAYPGSGDVLKQIAVILNFWNIKECFPVEFEPLNMGEQVKDETYSYLETLNETVTALV